MAFRAMAFRAMAFRAMAFRAVACRPSPVAVLGEAGAQPAGGDGHQRPAAHQPDADAPGDRRLHEAQPAADPERDQREHDRRQPPALAAAEQRQDHHQVDRYERQDSDHREGRERATGGVAVQQRWVDRRRGRRVPRRLRWWWLWWFGWWRWRRTWRVGHRAASHSGVRPTSWSYTPSRYWCTRRQASRPRPGIRNHCGLVRSSQTGSLARVNSTPNRNTA